MSAGGDIQERLWRQLGLAGEAFFGRFGSMNALQVKTIPLVLEGHDLLVLAPTASGKTEAAMAPVASLLTRMREREGIRCVYVTPTRALVNDLQGRLEARLAGCGLVLGRRTGEYRETDAAAVVLTTPESLDSMLARGVRRDQNGVSVGHMLSHVQCIIVDEVHALFGTPRGDQIAWLLERLRRLRLHAREKSWSSDGRLQIVALSASVADPDLVVRQFLSHDARTINLGSSGRSWQMFNDCSGSGHSWLEIANATLDTIAGAVICPEASWFEELESLLARITGLSPPDYVSVAAKVLVFVPSRNLVDSLARALLSLEKKAVRVYGHHGSLSKETRETAETGFRREARAVMVCTNTLELGIDIGSVDLVVQVGVPMDVSALLQRVGRGNRRSGHVRLLAVVRSETERAVLASVVHSAAQGVLDKRPVATTTAVALQQMAGHIFQARNSRSKGALRSLYTSMAARLQYSLSFDVLCDTLLVEGFFLSGRQGAMSVSGEVLDSVGPMGLHSNISSGAAMQVRDVNTMELIAEIASLTGTEVLIGGKSYSVNDIGAEGALVRRRSESVAAAAPTYATKGMPVSVAYARHKAASLGLEDAEMADLGDGRTVHFGGSLGACLLRFLGVTSATVWTASTAALAQLLKEPPGADRMSEIISMIDRDDLRSVAPVVPFSRFWPSDLRAAAASAALDLSWWEGWFLTRRFKVMPSLAEVFR